MKKLAAEVAQAAAITKRSDIIAEDSSAASAKAKIEPIIEKYWEIEINYASQDGRNFNIYEPESSKNL